jgi:hypothetical protein
VAVLFSIFGPCPGRSELVHCWFFNCQGRAGFLMSNGPQGRIPWSSCDIPLDVMSYIPSSVSDISPQYRSPDIITVLFLSYRVANLDLSRGKSLHVSYPYCSAPNCVDYAILTMLELSSPSVLSSHSHCATPTWQALFP